ncbi:MAG: copper homeostasis protein CutC [Planctomycetales bacterium]|nr:copper homeostasis protein CutC [Planctomycetales bacterium]
MNDRILLEVCIASTEDAVAALGGGADRLELNVGIELGGLTPSVGLLEQVKKAVAIPLVTMVRPRAAGFRYSAIERRIMLRDAELLLAAGADGIVSGALCQDGSLDVDFWKQLRNLSQGRDLVFHRALDVIPDPMTALQQLIDTGTTRVLTSGGCESAWQGRRQIARLQQKAGNQIEILAGAGVTPDNAVPLVRETGCSQLHGTFRELASDPASFVADGSYPTTSEPLVAAMRAALDELS